MTKYNSPCLDCPNKGCGAYHSTCPDYQAFKEYRAEIETRKRADKPENRDWIPHPTFMKRGRSTFKERK